MVLNLQNKQVHGLLVEELQLLSPYQFGEMIENTDIFMCFLRYSQHKPPLYKHVSSKSPKVFMVTVPVKQP